MYDYIQDPNGPIGRLLRSAQLHAGTTKVATFLYFVGTSPDGVYWTAPSYHFYLSCLFCLRVLLGATWRVTCKAWASPQGVQVRDTPPTATQNKISLWQWQRGLLGTQGRKPYNLQLPLHGTGQAARWP